MLNNECQNEMWQPFYPKQMNGILGSASHYFGFSLGFHGCWAERPLLQLWKMVQDLVKDKTYQHKQFNSYLLKMTQSKSLTISLWKMMIDSWFSPWKWWIFPYKNGNVPHENGDFPYTNGWTWWFSL